jgi:lipopolysaccharide export system permease protein
MILSILDRYIGRSILLTSMLVLMTLVALAGIFAFISELDDVGKGNYSVAKAAQYVFLTLPGKAWLLFAPSVLLGSLLGLGSLASNSELTVMRAAGVSNGSIIRAVLITGLGLMAVVAVLGETLVPRSEQIAEELRLTALEKRVSVKGRSGLWVKSGDRYINISTVMPDFTLLDLSIHRFTGNHLMEAMRVARASPAENDDWLLEDIDVTAFNNGAAEVSHISTVLWSDLVKKHGDGVRISGLVSSDVLKSLSISPDSLSARNLYDQVQYLNDNQLDSRRIELALWVKITSPLATIVMLMLSLPFVFGSQRSGGAGQRIFIGIMLGVVYVLLNKLLTQLGLANGLSPAVSALLPLVFFLSIAIVGIQRSA